MTGEGRSGNDLSGDAKRALGRLVFVVAIVGILVVGVFSYLFLSAERMVQRKSPLITTSVEVKYHLSLFHLMFEELIQGDPTLGPDDVFDHLDHTKHYVLAMRDGGEIEHGRLQAIEGPELRALIGHVLGGIEALREGAARRIRAGAGGGGDRDQAFDAQFFAVLDNAERIEKALIARIVGEYDLYRTSSLWLGAFLVLIAAVTGFVLVRLELNRIVFVRDLDRANTALEARLAEQSAVAEIVRHSLHPDSLADSLEASLGSVLFSPDVAFLPKGAIFLKDAETGDFVMAANVGLDSTHLEACGRLPSGRCLCGRAGATGEIVVSRRGETGGGALHRDAAEHGHYCVPIRAEAEVLGVLTLYLPEGHERTETEDTFVLTIASTLAGVIQRKRAEDEVRRARADLEKKVRERTRELTGEIVERLEAEEGLRKLTRAVEQSPVMVVITDVNGRIEYVNPKFSEMTGFSPEEALGATPNILKSGETPRPTYDALWSTIEEGRQWSGEFKNRRKDGTIFWASASISPVRDEDGIITHFVAVHEDISARKLAEQAAIEARAHAEAANRAKSEILANMSHELRTPLNAIIGFADSIREEIFGPLNHDRYGDYIQDIHTSGRHLLDLINDILDVSAIEAGKLELHPEPVDVTAIARSCTRLISVRADKAGVTLEIDLPDGLPAIVADSRRLKQILLNLLSNAVKFTPEGGVIGLNAALRGGDLELTVRDSGIGMDADGIAKALTPFGQIDGSLARRHDGTGLGLPLTAGLVELHGGRLAIDSAPSQGTRVTVGLPIDGPCPDPAPSLP